MGVVIDRNIGMRIIVIAHTRPFPQPADGTAVDAPVAFAVHRRAIFALGQSTTYQVAVLHRCNHVLVHLDMGT